MTLVNNRLISDSGMEVAPFFDVSGSCDVDFASDTDSDEHLSLDAEDLVDGELED